MLNIYLNKYFKWLSHYDMKHRWVIIINNIGKSMHTVDFQLLKK